MENVQAAPSQLPPMHDHRVIYSDIPESMLEVPERRVNPDNGQIHALGAKAIEFLEREALVSDRLALTKQHIKTGEKIVDTTTFGDKVKHTKFLERPYPKLRQVIDRSKKRAASYERALVNVSKNKKLKIQEARDDLRVRQLAYGNQPKEFDVQLFTNSPTFLKELYMRDVLEAQELGIYEPTMSSWLLEASEVGDERLLNFLKNHVHKVEKDQDNPELNNELMREKREWLAGVDKGMEEGWLHPSAERVFNGMQSLVTRFADYFDLGAKDRGGYSLQGIKYIVLGRDGSLIRHAAKHEMNHALLGKFSDTWLDEAITEHLAQVIDNRRDIEDLSHQNSEGLTDHSYREARDVLKALIDMSDGTIKVADITRIYSDETSANHGNQKDVHNLFSAAFGEPRIEVLALLNQHIEALVKKYKEEGHGSMNALKLACHVVHSDLLQQPHVILGESFRIPEVKISSDNQPK